MITKTYYDMPYPSAVPTTMEGVKDYLDDITDWLADSLGLIIREDLTVEAPSYAQYSYVKFLAESASDDPYLAVYNPNLASGIRWNTFCISPVKKVTDNFMPVYVVFNASTNGNWATRNYGSIVVNYSSLGVNDYKHYIAVADMGDERKLAWVKSIKISTGIIVSRDNESLIYFGNIRMRGTLEKTCVVIADGPNSAWIDKYEQCACSTVLTTMAGLGIGAYNQTDGIIFDRNVGKEYILDVDFCIGEDAYIPNVYQYSDSKRQLYEGTVFSINDKRYIAAHVHVSSYAVLIIPEEVN